MSGTQQDAMADSATESNESTAKHVATMDFRQRRSSAILGLMLLGLLVVAGVLTPSSDGMGTHQQLGLPPCTTVALFGIRCPTCGMTTSWSHFMRGNWSASWNSNPGGFCLAIVSAIAGVWALSTSVRGVYRPLVPMRVGIAVAVGVGAITLIDWFGRIF